MNTRRQFAVHMLRMVIGGVALTASPASALLSRALAAATRRILPRETDLQGLKNEHPATLDSRQLDIMPIEKFETMGPTDHEESLDRYRCEVCGRVRRNLSLSYAELLVLPAVEENALLICPGVFTIHARWKGIRLHELLKVAGPLERVAHLTVHGPRGPYEKVESFSLAEVEAGKVFLAYAVNGQTLPQKHGFPLRVVAPDRFGSDWVKYVYKIEAR